MVRGLTPRRRPRKPMVLTPLVDIVFLLLTFFMLSSQLSPFSLVPIEGGAPAAEVEAAPAAPLTGETAPDALLSVRRGSVRLDGRVVEPSGLLEALQAEARSGTSRITILTAEDATVQDFVEALEASKVVGFASISVANMR